MLNTNNARKKPIYGIIYVTCTHVQTLRNIHTSTLFYCILPIQPKLVSAMYLWYCSALHNLMCWLNQMQLIKNTIIQSICPCFPYLNFEYMRCKCFLVAFFSTIILEQLVTPICIVSCA